MVAFLSGAVLTAANLNSAFNALTFRAVTGTSDTFVLADNGGAVSYSNASPITATVPPFSSVAYANGTTIELLNLGAGVVTVTAGVGVTLNGSSVAIAQNAGGTLIKTATNTWYFLPSSTGSGMDLITPTSVAGSGVTLSGGEVTFTAATTISAVGVFTSAYDNYRIYFSLTTGASGSMSMRLRSGATDASGANYAHQRADFLNTGSTFIRVSGATNWFSQTLATDWNSFSIDLFRPALAVPTSGLVMSSRETGSNIDLDIYSLGHGLSTAYDGLTIAPGSASTGKLRIYGLRNS